MTGFALIVAAVLGALAILHLAWAIGFWVPIRDEGALARAVVGTRDVSRMPGAVPCALVAVALAFVATLPFTPGFPAQRPLLAAAALVFFVRGVLTYTAAWRRIRPAQPFSTLDRRFYGPLCLALGAGLGLLAVTGE